jgi:hypothetical protein
MQTQPLLLLNKFVRKTSSGFEEESMYDSTRQKLEVRPVRGPLQMHVSGPPLVDALQSFYTVFQHVDVDNKGLVLIPVVKVKLLVVSVRKRMIFASFSTSYKRVSSVTACSTSCSTPKLTANYPKCEQRVA